EAVPGTGAAALLPAAVLPGLTAELALFGDDVEAPGKPAAGNIEREDVSRGGAVAFVRGGPEEYQVAIDHRRCGEADVALFPAHAHQVTQLDAPRPVVRIELSRAGVHADHAPIRRA